MIEVEGKIVELLESPEITFQYNFEKEGDKRKANITIGFLENGATYVVTEQDPEYRIYEKEGEESFEHFFKKGVFLFVNQELVEYRPSGYIKNGGFCRTENDIYLLAQQIGLLEIQRQREKKENVDNMFANFSRYGKSNFSLSGQSRDFEIEIPDMKDGGHMLSRNSFKWSAFSSQIETHVSFERLSCLNGMVSTSNFLNTSVNIQNEWEENIRIANIALNNKIVSLLNSHFSKMAYSPASLNLIGTINSHAEIRLGNENITPSEKKRLTEIYSATDVEQIKRYLNIKYGKIKPVSNEHAASMLTLFDAWNLTTEMATHTPEHGRSTMVYLNRLANKIVFDNKYKMNISKSTKDYYTPSFSWSDVERAFWGE